MEIDKYTKRILTTMAIGLFVNAGLLIYQVKSIDEAETLINITSYDVGVIRGSVNEINKTLGEIKRIMVTDA